MRRVLFRLPASRPHQTPLPYAATDPIPTLTPSRQPIAADREAMGVASHPAAESGEKIEKKSGAAGAAPGIDSEAAAEVAGFLAYVADLTHLLVCPTCGAEADQLPPPPPAARAFLRHYGPTPRYQILLRRLGGAIGPLSALQPQCDTLDYLEARRAACQAATRERLHYLQRHAGTPPPVPTGPRDTHHREDEPSVI